jgi:hypothetical protein
MSNASFGKIVNIVNFIVDAITGIGDKLKKRGKRKREDEVEKANRTRNGNALGRIMRRINKKRKDRHKSS